MFILLFPRIPRSHRSPRGHNKERDGGQRCSHSPPPAARGGHRRSPGQTRPAAVRQIIPTKKKTLSRSGHTGTTVFYSQIKNSQLPHSALLQLQHFVNASTSRKRSCQLCTRKNIQIYMNIHVRTPCRVLTLMISPSAGLRRRSFPELLHNSHASLLRLHISNVAVNTAVQCNIVSMRTCVCGDQSRRWDKTKINVHTVKNVFHNNVLSFLPCSLPFFLSSLLCLPAGFSSLLSPQKVALTRN